MKEFNIKGINIMKLSQILKKIHALIESKEIQNISQQEMANRLGVSLRTYTEWLRDVNQPLAMRAILDMFSQLNDDDIVKIVRAWQTSRVK
ncbi:hypothetical protein HpHA137_06720 [Helicobacter pylori]